MEMQLFRITVMGSGDKREIIRKALSSEVSVLYWSSKWTVSESAFAKVEDSEVVSGYLIKYSDEDREIYLEKDKVVARALLPDAVQVRCLVVIDMKNWVVAFQRTPAVSPRTATEVLKKVITEGNGGIFVSVVMEEISDREEFVESVKSMDIVNFVTYTIHPSNPRWKPDWEMVDRDLQDGNVGQWRSLIKPRVEGEGLKLFPSSRALSGILMAADGYGRAAVRGIKNGVATLLRTRDGLKVIDVGNGAERSAVVEATARQIEVYERGLDSGKA